MTSRRGWPQTTTELAELSGVALADMEAKRARGDMHGVSDAANDIRELEAYFRGYLDGITHALDEIEPKVKRRAG